MISAFATSQLSKINENELFSTSQPSEISLFGFPAVPAAVSLPVPGILAAVWPPVPGVLAAVSPPVPSILAVNSPPALGFSLWFRRPSQAFSQRFRRPSGILCMRMSLGTRAPCSSVRISFIVKNLLFTFSKFGSQCSRQLGVVKGCLAQFFGTQFFQ